MKKIGIIYGGKSVEHDISVITALQTISNLSKKYKCIPIYIDGNGSWWSGDNLKNIGIYSDFDKKVKHRKQVCVDFNNHLFIIGRKKVKVECCVICNHGLNGEDGTLSGVFELADIPYSCSGVLSSALSMDKVVTKILLEHEGIRTTNFCYFEENDLQEKEEQIKEMIKEVGYPLIVKPANLGSSVGISVVRNEGELYEKLNIAFHFDKKILVEQYLEEAREFNCACFMYDREYYPSDVFEVSKGDIFTFEEKYIDNRQEQKEIDENLVEGIKEVTQEVYKCCQCFGIVRVDYLFKDGKLYVNEINNIPGSLANGLYKENYFEVLDLVIQESINRKESKKEIKYSYESDVLKIFENKKRFYKMKK